MTAKKVLIVLTMLGIFSAFAQASEKYHVVKVWPEAPRGFHFYQPKGVAVDKAGNVYIGDSGNYRIKKFDSEGRFITQWGSPGQGDGQFEMIGSIKVDSSGTVYVLDTDFGKWEHNRIQKFTPYGQFIATLERKAADADKIKLPIDLAPDDEDSVLVLAVDYNPKRNRTYGVRIEKYSRDGEFISQWGTDAGSGDGQLMRPRAIDVDAMGNVYIVDGDNDRVQKFDSDGKFMAKWGAEGEGNGLFRTPRSIAVNKAGYLHVLDNYCLQKFSPEGVFLARWLIPDRIPNRIALDSHSNIYITNETLHTMCKLDSSGSLVSRWGIAGNKDSQFNSPGSIALDSSGNAFIADVGNYRIQKFDDNTRFLTDWGDEHWFGVGGLATDMSGNLYVTCEGSDEIQKFDLDGNFICRWGSSGSGDGQFQFPVGIAVGPLGDVYVTDATNCRIQKFTSDGKFLAKWGTKGTGDGQFDNPFFVAVDESGHVWVGDQLSNRRHRMQKFDSDGRFLTKWTRKIMVPPGIGYTGAVDVDSSGNSYYGFESKIEKYDSEGNLISNYGQEDIIKDKLDVIRGMHVNKAGYLYIADGDGSIRKYDDNGKLVSKWTGKNTAEKEGFPRGPLVVNGTGNVYTSSVTGPTIWKLSPDGRLTEKFDLKPPSREGRFTLLGGVSVDSVDKVYAVESVDVDWGWGIPSIQKFDSNGQFITIWEVPEEAKGKFKYPAVIAVDASGNAYVTDKSSHCVHKFDAQGKYIQSWGSKGTGDGQFDTPEGIAVDRSGNIYVCDRQNSRIQKFDTNGRFLAKWGKEGSGDGEFHFPAAVALDKDGNIYVADSDNNRIQKFTAEGKFLTEWGEFGEAPGQLNVPLGITVDAAGNVYVSDSHNHRIQKFAPVPSR